MKDSAAVIIADHARESTALRDVFFRTQANLLREVALRAASCLAKGGKILLCGNGGSASCTQHIAAEFVHRCSMDRPALPAIALSTNTATMTSVSEALDFTHVFSRQVEALGRPGDMLIGISCSSDCDSILIALLTAKRYGLLTVALDQEDSIIHSYSDIAVTVPNATAQIVQEVHLAAGHIICRLTDYYLFENPTLLSEYINNK